MIGGEVFVVLVLFGIVAWAWREQVRNPNAALAGQCEDWLAVRRDMAAGVVRFLEEELESRSGAGEEYEGEAAKALTAARMVSLWLEEQDELHGAPTR